MEQSLPPDVQRLIEQLKSPDPIERIRTVQGLAKLDCRDESVRLALEEVAWSDPELDIRSEARYALGKLGLPIYPPDGWISPKLDYAPPGTDGEKLNFRQRFLAFRYGMSPNTFDLMLKSLVVALILGFLLTMWCEQISPVLFLIGLGLLLSAFIFTIFFPFLARVRCDRKDCNERMQRVWTKESIFQYRMTYRCNRCGHIYDPGFTFRFGGPSDF